MAFGDAVEMNVGNGDDDCDAAVVVIGGCDGDAVVVVVIVNGSIVDVGIDIV